MLRRTLVAIAALLLAHAGSTVATATTTPPGDGCVYSGGGWLCTGGWDTGPAPYRVAGDDRYATAVALSGAFGQGHDGPAVYLVAHDGVDALPLAGYALNGPILYVPRGSDRLPGAIADHLAALDPAPTHVYAIGGTGAVSDEQLDAAVAAAGE